MYFHENITEALATYNDNHIACYTSGRDLSGGLFVPVPLPLCVLLTVPDLPGSLRHTLENKNPAKDFNHQK